MAFVAEDGTGLSTSTSYISIADADSYFEDRINTDWKALSLDEKQAYLIGATDYFESNYNVVEGTPINTTQALQFPRYGTLDLNDNEYDYDSVPLPVKKSTCILAEEIMGSVDINAGIDRKTKSEKAGPVEVEYMDGSASTKIYKQIEGMLRGIIQTRGTVATLRG